MILPNSVHYMFAAYAVVTGLAASVFLMMGWVERDDNFRKSEAWYCGVVHQWYGAGCLLLMPLLIMLANL